MRTRGSRQWQPQSRGVVPLIAGGRVAVWYGYLHSGDKNNRYVNNKELVLCAAQKVSQMEDEARTLHNTND